ncbi:MAG: anthrax toxin-like adenylyl cyclase domain-containing protein [Endozoicomonas sp.]|uniref:anthrax toxin-like adenylyl cyclase domain-containing protein n=1 Tax=Endozoicomonas sp. TaxID=1892382 RepID=UPI003D9B80F4
MAGGVTTGGFPTDYALGPKETEVDRFLIRQAFTRKVELRPVQESYIKLQPKQTFLTDKELQIKPLKERSFEKREVENQIPRPENNKESIPASPPPVRPKPKVDRRSIDLDKNPFLKSDHRVLNKKELESPPQSRRGSFQALAKKAVNVDSVQRAFSRRGSLSENVLIGFNKVSNYENQGIPPDYLKRTQAVSNRENVIIAIRPVELICQTLIEEGFQSKPLSIKGKSSNWGPMAGLIPVDQHFSKLSGNSDKVAKFNEVNRQAIEVDQVATPEHLHISKKRLRELESLGMLEGLTPTEPAQGYKDAFVFTSAPRSNTGPAESFEAHLREDGQWDIFSGAGESRQKLMVLPYTADFDLLFVHSHYEDVDLGQQDRYGELDPVLGIYSKRKLEIINALNTEYGREDNPMVHHGTDNKNPYTDMNANLPTTVFIPESMLNKMGIYSDTPILIKTEEELSKLYRTMRDNGIKIEMNTLWDEFKDVALEPIRDKVNSLEKADGKKNSHG